MIQIGQVRSMVCILVAVTLVITPFGAAALASNADGRFIVTYVDGSDLNAEKKLLQNLTILGIKIVEVTQVLTLINALAIKITPLSLVEDLLALLNINDHVAAVDDDIKGSAAEVTPITKEDIAANPLKEGWPWNEVHISAPYVPLGSNGAGVKVAVLDSGIHCAHPELQANIASSLSFSAIKGKNACNDDNGHGTHVAGTIAARDDQNGIIGVAPRASLVTVKVLDQNARTFVSSVIAGLQFVHQHKNEGIRVVNMSFGFYEESEPLKRAIDRLYANGMIMVASAGNCGDSGYVDGGGGDGGGGVPASSICDPSQLEVTYPAAYGNKVIGVGASTIAGEIAYYSRIGEHVEDVDVSAPGGAPASGCILSTARDGGYALKCGTSMAAAHVSGAVALALQQNSELSFGDVLYVLQSTVSNIPGSPEQKGAGQIDVEAMLLAPQLQ